MPIIEVTRGHVTIQVGDKSVTAWGEMLCESPGLADYLIYGYSIKYWNDPNGKIPISPDQQVAVLAEACDYLKQLNRIPEVLE